MPSKIVAASILVPAAMACGIAANAQVKVPASGSPPCVAGQLSLSVDGGGGRFDGMQKSGTELSIRNHGADCVLPALPRIELLDPRGRTLPVARAVPVGMHPGPVMIPLRLAAGHRAATDLTWVSGPAYARNAPLRFAYLRVSVGNANLRARLVGVVDAPPGRPATFVQPPLRAMEGMAADRS